MRWPRLALLVALAFSLCTAAHCSNSTWQPSDLVVRWNRTDSPSTKQAILSTLRCPQNSELHTQADGARCCSTCPAGHVIQTFCRLDGDTVCMSCVDGVAFAATGVRCDACRSCAANDPNSHVVKPCGVTSDTVCACNDGFFLDADTQRCTKCTRCPPGFGVLSKCSATSDSVCEPCANGTHYSDAEDNYKWRCKRCTHCAFATEAVCTPSTNSKCTPLWLDARWPLIPQTQPNTGKSNDSLADSDGEQRDAAYNDSGLIPLYCGIMGLVIVSSVVYAVVKQRKQYVKKRQAKALASCRQLVSVHTANSSCATSSSTSPVSACATVRTDAAEPLLSCLPPPPPPWHLPRKSCYVSDDAVELLCSLLPAETDVQGVSAWRRLAAELNFHEPDVCAAEYEAAAHACPPLYVLLTQLAHAEDSWLTQAVLREALIRIGLADLCSQLHLPPVETTAEADAEAAHPVGC